MFNIKRASIYGALLLSLGSCKEDTQTPEDSGIELKNHSVTPALVKGLPSGVTAYALVSSDDALEQSAGFIFGGSADGMGLLKNSDGTFMLLTNHEDNFSVSRVTLDKNLKPVKGEYLMNSNAGTWRLCSSTLAESAEHGFGPLYLTCGESSVESMIHAIDPAGAPNSSRTLSALGHWNAEQALPLQTTAYPGKTVILMGDDDSGPEGGQVAMYLANTVGDLDNGNLYTLARVDNNIEERNMVVGQKYQVEFRQIADQKTKTGAQINTDAVTLNSIQFGRVEDIDYRKKGNGRELYFCVTGQDTKDANAGYTRSKYGRIYRLVLNATDPTKGELEVILDGDDRNGNAKLFQNPDNICVTENYVYIQEDPNGYGDETHDAHIYQYNIATKAVQVVMELDHHRADPAFAKYNVGANAAKFGAWEYGALIDVSDKIGRENVFMLAIQPHTWRDAKYKSVDGGTARPNEDQASQVLIIDGLPR